LSSGGFGRKTGGLRKYEPDKHKQQSGKANRSAKNRDRNVF
jgi:hypothetical protein